MSSLQVLQYFGFLVCFIANQLLTGPSLLVLESVLCTLQAGIRSAKLPRSHKLPAYPLSAFTSNAINKTRTAAPSSHRTTMATPMPPIIPCIPSMLGSLSRTAVASIQTDTYILAALLVVNPPTPNCCLPAP